MSIIKFSPFFLISEEVGIRLSSSEYLSLPPGITPSDLPAEITTIKLERVIFAFRIPHLPDPLQSQSLVQSGNADRLKEALDRQARLISHLVTWQDVGFALRYSADPLKGSVDLAFLVRVLSPVGESRRQAEEVLADLTVALSSYDLPIEPVRSDEELRSILEPFPDPFVLEVRPHEEVRNLRGGDAYVVLPFPAPSTDWYSVLDTMLRLKAPCLISILLQPTCLYPQERLSFGDAVYQAGLLVDRTFHGMTGEHPIGDSRWMDVARLYAHYLEQLREPFLVQAQVASPDLQSVRAVAQSLAAEVGTISDDILTSPDGTRLPTGVQIDAPGNASQLAAAQRALRYIDIQPWGVNPGHWKERLRYLADNKSANAVFRFPVDVGRGLPGIASRQVAPSHESRPRRSIANSSEIVLGHDLTTGAIVGVQPNAFTRHTLVAGINGSGKTTTCMHLLGELWEQKIPFLVIEPAKTEYRTLLDSPIGSTLQVFTLGDESVSPFRLNPLEILPGIRVETHISSLRACFEAALPTFGVLPSLIEESLHSVYLKRGWKLTDRGGIEDRLCPTLSEFYVEIIRTVEGSGYSEKTQQDILAAASRRIRSLLFGSKGRMLNTRHSISFESLMNRPTVLELDALNDEEKALVMLFVLTLIREYCRVNRNDSQLSHVTLVEEAHRVMAAQSHARDREVSVDTGAAASDLFSAMLSEVRAFGEGIIISEQIPSRLTADALKNTNTKIVHRLPGADDREDLAATMNMSDEGELFLAKLNQGQAAVLVEGLERPAFVAVPDYRALHNIPARILDTHLAELMSASDAIRDIRWPFDGCGYCQCRCDYRDIIGPLAFEPRASERLIKSITSIRGQESSATRGTDWPSVASHCLMVTNRARPGDMDAAYCYLSHLWSDQLNTAHVLQFRRAMEDIVGRKQ